MVFTFCVQSTMDLGQDKGRFNPLTSTMSFTDQLATESKTQMQTKEKHIDRARSSNIIKKGKGPFNFTKEI